MLSAHIRVLIDEICRIVLHVAAERSKSNQQELPLALEYYHAMETTLALPTASRNPANPYGSIVHALMSKKPPIEEYHIVSLFVAINAFVRDGRKCASSRVIEDWKYLEELSKWSLQLHQASIPADSKRVNREKLINENGWIGEIVRRAARLGVEGVGAIVQLVGPLDKPKFDKHQEIWENMNKLLPSLKDCADYWNAWHENIVNRIKDTCRVFSEFLPGRPNGYAPTLDELVALPKKPKPGDHNLLRYLWGCGLLGAEHLQHPENIILAAHDLVRQNVQDYVVYTEVRCETPGYTRAGMSAETVTDLLCASFDIAEVFEREVNRRPFARTNVLLAAKRHKKEKDIERVVSLLSSYLRRPREPLTSGDPKIPAWWKTTQVVGFDLSGDESKNSEALEQQISRLTELSSHITIHAGEAASAESIWRAVYEYHARRIGHGVRLREQRNLLKFCINEGICMEMCPISNRFASDFIQIDHTNENRYDPHRIEHYPLRYFMESGLEVCINTDNRSLRGAYGQTLTDEYLWAAHLSGGFTRWQVLALIKAGFKHAFIDKRDIQELLLAVENWMFAQVADAPGLNWKPLHGATKQGLSQLPTDLGSDEAGESVRFENQLTSETVQ